MRLRDEDTQCDSHKERKDRKRKVFLFLMTMIKQIARNKYNNPI